MEHFIHEIDWKLIGKNDDENKLLFGAANAFGDQNKFVIDEMSWYIGECTPNLKTEEMLNRRLHSKKPQNVSYLKRRCQHVKLNQTTYTWNLGVLEGKPRYLWIIFKNQMVIVKILLLIRIMH